MRTGIADANILMVTLTSSSQVDRIVLAAIKASGKSRKADKESTAGIDTYEKTGIIYANRYLHGLLETIHDKDCMYREFNAGDQSFNTEEAISILSKCKLLVLQKIFDKTFLTAYRNNFTNYINNINSGRISSDRWTSNGENFYMYMIYDLRWDVFLHHEFSHPDLLTNTRVTGVLTENVILEDDLSLHSLGTSLTEPRANAQAWNHNEKLSLLGVLPPDEWHSGE